MKIKEEVDRNAFGEDSDIGWTTDEDAEIGTEVQAPSSLAVGRPGNGVTNGEPPDESGSSRRRKPARWLLHLSLLQPCKLTRCGVEEYFTVSAANLHSNKGEGVTDGLWKEIFDLLSSGNAGGGFSIGWPKSGGSASNGSLFLYIGRLLEGFGVGIISYVVPVYIAEIAPQNLRGGLGSVNQLSVTIGILLAYLLGLFVNWRALAVLGILPCLILIPGLFFIPESPRWLAKMGMTDDFEASLQVLRGFDTDISIEVNEIKRSVASTSRRTGAIRFADLKLRRYWLPLMIGIGLLVLQQLSGVNGVLFYSATIFESAGITSSNAATVGVGVIQVIATAVSTWLVDKTGRRVLLTVSSSGMAVSLLVVAVAFFLKGFFEPDSSLYSILGIVSVVGILFMIVSFSLGMGPIPWLIMSEILPVKIKGLAGSVATLLNWFSSWLITMTAPLLLTWSSGGTFSVYTVVCILTAAFVTIWVPETKGKTLEEIQSSFR